MEVSECPQCGAPADTTSDQCAFCKAPFVISTLSQLNDYNDSAAQKYANTYRRLVADDPNDAEGQLALGLCYLKLGTHDFALAAFKRAVEACPDCEAAYFYCACATIAGKKLKLLGQNEVKQVEQYLNAALVLRPDEPKYLGLSALIKHESYRMNGLRVLEPTVDELLDKIRTSGGLNRTTTDELLSLAKATDEGFVEALRCA